MVEITKKLDARGMRCPIPVLRATKEIKAMESEQVIEITATDGQAPKDFADYCEQMGHELLSSTVEDDLYIIVIQKG